MNKDQLEKELNQAVDGLLMKSEIEAPFEFFYRELEQGEQFSSEKVTEWTGEAAGMEVATKELDEFFNETGGIAADARNKGESNEQRTQMLKSRLNELLEDVKVYMITEIGTQVFILGKTEDGNYAGLRTMVVDDEASVE
ncbi:sugar-non-specific nuclease inhibitor NuiA-like protein [Pontibacter diazotrophicus]|uniref:Sugar-non-specific nuclease inhibitor NuiA-like protein n=1 Tax=Pontibacter diazotrophicus TaxID=1400979 RepID=A0A3D8L9H8_9BACT|nr:nuclease A inhibitor family protein [Pontibacter diazotrophicus]RDV14003.1 sugar-non-specific nuclease inhibitor NuiA-like protein [Pontibacter diazotrophicus]